MTEALEERKSKDNKAVGESKVCGESKKVRDKEDAVSSAETAKEMVEDTLHTPDKNNIKVTTIFVNQPSRENVKTEDVAH